MLRALRRSAGRDLDPVGRNWPPLVSRQHTSASNVTSTSVYDVSTVNTSPLHAVPFVMGRVLVSLPRLRQNIPRKLFGGGDAITSFLCIGGGVSTGVTARYLLIGHCS